MQSTRADYADYVEAALLILLSQSPGSRHELVGKLQELVEELRKPRLTLPNEKLEAGGWQQVTMTQNIGVSSTGWRLVWDALRAAMRGRSVEHFDKPMVLALWVKPGQDTYVAGAQGQGQ